MIPGRHNMSESFYEYIVDDLLAGYFKANPVVPGSRYYIIIENDDYRKMFRQAVEKSNNFKDTYIPNINADSPTGIEEGIYHTRELHIDNQTPLLMGFSDTAKDDYLNMLRNHVGKTGTMLSDYAIIFVLSNNNMESLTTASVNLESATYPLNSNEIRSNIEQRIKNATVIENERVYLRTYVDRLSQLIDDGACSLFDFDDILNVLKQGTLKGNFTKLGFFDDNAIYAPSFPTMEPKNMEKRANDNAEFYEMTQKVLNSDDDDKIKVDRIAEWVDRKVAKKIVDNDSNKPVSFDEISDGIDRKKQSTILDFEEPYLKNNKTDMTIITRITGAKKHKRCFVIICDANGTDVAYLNIKFNKNIKDYVSDKDNCETKGYNLTLHVSDMMKNTVKDENSEVNIYAVKLQARENVFDNVRHNFTLSKSGNILIDVPDDESEVIIGNGNNRINYPFSNIEWNDDYSLHIQTDTEYDKDKLSFDVQFGSTNATFVLNLNSDKPPVMEALPLFEKIWTDSLSFHKVMRQGLSNDDFVKICNDKDNNDYYVSPSLRKYLVIEQKMISEHAYCLESVEGMFPEPDGFDAVELNLPGEVKAGIDAIYDYYAGHNTVPTLAYIDDELKTLYENYLDAVCRCIEQFDKPQMNGSPEYSITRLGIVKNHGKVCLSPFHPVLVAFMLQFKHEFEIDGYDSNGHEIDRKLLSLVSPNNIIPYISLDNIDLQPCSVYEDLKTWLFYDSVRDKKQIRSHDFTPDVVTDKMSCFIDHFHYLFSDKDCPLIINVVGVEDDTNIVKGVLQFIKKQLRKGQVQRVCLNEYVGNMLSETFFEKLNRLSDDKIMEELCRIGLETDQSDKADDYSIDMKTIKRQLFTRVTFFKHRLTDKVNYAHITFFEFNTGKEFVIPYTDNQRLEMAFDGLVSTVSTQKTGAYYLIGFGTKGLKPGSDRAESAMWVYRTAKAMNTLYANGNNDGVNHFVKDCCIAKKFNFNATDLLNSIYDNSNWVTFLNPEVDIDFFYKQDGLYIIHYIDQSSINARYDSITVTKHVTQYKNMLNASYKSFSLDSSHFSDFNERMLSYFNCLNGNWLLSVINQTKVKIREKMSLVAACILMKQFMRRAGGMVWVPISLEDILRVTGSIGLPMNSLFSKKSLDIKGRLSDALLMMGLDDSDHNNIRLYIYPVEVKYAQNNSVVKNGEEQVVKTYNAFKENIIDGKGFRRNIYATFFASQFLTNADKFSANGRLSPEEKERIDNCRYELLNLRFTMPSHVPEEMLGNAAIVYFTDAGSRELFLCECDDVPVCHIHLSEKECYQCVANSTKELKQFVDEEVIDVKQGDEDENNAEGDNKKAEDDSNNTEDDNNNAKEDFKTAAKKPASNNPHYGLYTGGHHIADNQAKDNCNKTEDNSNHSEESTATAKDEKEEQDAVPADMQQPVRVIVGSSLTTNKDISFEPNDTKKLSHPNMGIIGTMGTGKTQLARSIIAQLSKEGGHNVGKRPIGVLVFDYKGDYNGKDFLERVDGKCYRTNFPFNPFKLIAVPGLEGVNLPAVTADTISDSFAKAYNLGVKQKSHIKDVIKDVYNDYGITADPSTWSRPVPTLNDVIESYFEKYDAKDSVYALFSSLNDYSIFTNDNSNCVSIFEWLQGVRVIDLTIFPDDTKRVIVSLILDLFYSEMKKLGASRTSGRYRELRAMIMVDEAHQFLSKEFNSLRRIISEGRMFGVGMILSTQNLSDFKSSHEDYSQYILSWAIHHVNSISKSELASVFGASDPHWQDYMDFINRAEIFQSICKLGSRVDGIKDLPYFELLKKDPRFEKMIL